MYGRAASATASRKRARSASDNDATRAFHATSLKTRRYSSADASSRVAGRLSTRMSEKPASRSSDSSWPGGANRKGPGAPGLGGWRERKEAATPLIALKNGLFAGSSHTARATRPPGSSTRLDFGERALGVGTEHQPVRVGHAIERRLLKPELPPRPFRGTGCCRGLRPLPAAMPRRSSAAKYRWR